MPQLELTRVATRAQIKEFVRLPHYLYPSDSLWVPPLTVDEMKLLDQSRHPFWRQARREMFMVHRKGSPVGRIAAVVDESHNRCHGEQAGAWGFFECRSDPEAAALLFKAAQGWLRDEGMKLMRGPLNPSLNYTAGLLVEGFEEPPALMMPYNPPYYVSLVKACGLVKEKDLYSFRVTNQFQAPAWAMEMSRRIVEKEGITFEHADHKNIHAQMRRMNRQFQEAWQDNWGMVPMSDEELDKMASELMPILKPDFAFFLCKDGREVGFFLALLDANPFLKRLKGKRGISALIKKSLYFKEINGLRILLFGMEPSLQRVGLAVAAFRHLMEKLYQHSEIEYVEAGWTLEDNQDINHVFLEGGLRASKRYRIFRKEL